MIIMMATIKKIQRSFIVNKTLNHSHILIIIIIIISNRCEETIDHITSGCPE